MPSVNPKILIWARETAGLNTADAAKALGMSAEDRLTAFEAGLEAPSRSMLVKMASKYRRSLLTFYLDTPPRKGDRGQDFRTVSAARSVAADALVDALIRDIKARQELVRTTLEDEDEPVSLSFIGSLNTNDGVEKVAAAIQAGLKTTLAEYRRQKSSEEAFSLLRERAEAMGVFVLLIGNLGSHHTTIPVEVFRGFAIADQVAPFVIINDQDAKTAWSFTLIHELAHLWIGATGVSGYWADIAVEKFCNEVTSQFLLPIQEIKDLQLPKDISVNDAIAVIAQFASSRYISRPMVAYRLHRSGALDWEKWRAIDGKLQEMFQREKAQRKEKERGGDSGPSYYVVRRHRLGKALLDFAERSVAAGSLSPVKAAKVLGVKPRSVFPLLADQGFDRNRADARGGV